jgi:hypothetical protein
MNAVQEGLGRKRCVTSVREVLATSSKEYEEIHKKVVESSR